MKKLFILCILLLTTFLLSSCSGGSYSLLVGSLDSNNTSITGSYNRFNGFYFREVTLNAGEQVNFHFDINTEEGTLKGVLKNQNGATIIEITDDLVYTVEATGTYKVQVEGSNHSGSFNLSWFK